MLASLEALDQGKVSREDLLRQVQEAHSKHGTHADPCRVKAFEARKTPWQKADIDKLHVDARGLLKTNTELVAKTKKELAELVSGSASLNPVTEEQALLQLREQLQPVGEATQQLAEMDPDSDSFKPRNEVLRSAHSSDCVQSMTAEQKSAAFREIGRSRVEGRRQSCIAFATAMLGRNRLPAKVEEIHAKLISAAKLGRDGEDNSSSKVAADSVAEDMEKDLASRKLQQEECQKIRQKSAEEKAKAQADLQKVLEELMRAATAYADADTKLHAQDVALDLLQADIQLVESSKAACVKAAANASSACQACADHAAGAEQELRESVAAPSAALGKRL